MNYRPEDRPMVTEVKDELRRIAALTLPLFEELKNELTDQQMTKVILLAQLTGKYWHTKAKGERASDILLFEGHDEDETERAIKRNRVCAVRM